MLVDIVIEVLFRNTFNTLLNNLYLTIINMIHLLPFATGIGHVKQSAGQGRELECRAARFRDRRRVIVGTSQ